MTIYYRRSEPICLAGHFSSQYSIRYTDFDLDRNDASCSGSTCPPCLPLNCPISSHGYFGPHCDLYAARPCALGLVAHLHRDTGGSYSPCAVLGLTPCADPVLAPCAYPRGSAHPAAHCERNPRAVDARYIGQSRADNASTACARHGADYCAYGSHQDRVLCCLPRTAPCAVPRLPRSGDASNAIGLAAYIRSGGAHNRYPGMHSGIAAGIGVNSGDRSGRCIPACNEHRGA